MASKDLAENFKRIAADQLLFTMDSTKDAGEYLIDPEGGDIASNKYLNVPYSIVPKYNIVATPSGGVPEGADQDVCYTSLPIPVVTGSEPTYNICDPNYRDDINYMDQQCEEAATVRFSNGVWRAN